MTKKNVLFGAIQCLQNNNQSSLLSINRAEKLHYLGNEDDPYYMISLPKTDELLELGENQCLASTEHHLTCFAHHESQYRQSDLHYTAMFENGSKLRVFINQHNESTGDVSYHVERTGELIDLNAEQLEQVIQYALSYTRPLLLTLRKEHKTLRELAQKNYTESLLNYDKNVFNSTPSTEEQLTHAKAALSALDILYLIDDTDYRKDRREILKIMNGLENPLTAAVTKSDTNKPPITEDHAANEDVLTDIIITPQPFSRETQQRAALFQWHHLKQKAQELTDAQKNIPNPITSDSIASDSTTSNLIINSEYLHSILELDEKYRAFVSAFIIFEEYDDLASIASMHERNEMYRTSKEQHIKSVIKCLGTLLTFPFPCDMALREDVLQTLKNYASELNPQQFRALIARDDAHLMMFLLESFPFQTTMLPAAKSASMHASAAGKNLLEEIIEKRALNCLRQIIKQNYHMNFLNLASDGLPLAAHVLRLDLTDNFRYICLLDIRAFHTDAFYRKLITLLKTQPHRESDIVNAEMARSLRHRMFNPLIELLDSIPEAIKHAMTKLDHKVQAKFAHLRQLACEINHKSDIIAAHNPNYRRQFAAASISKLTETLKQLNDDPQEFIDVISNKRHVHDVLDTQLKYLYEVNEFLYYSLPDSSFLLVNQLSVEARTNLRSYHLEKLKTLKLFINDPLSIKSAASAMKDVTEAVYERINSVAESLQSISAALQANKLPSEKDIDQMISSGKQLQSITAAVQPVWDTMPKPTNREGARTPRLEDILESAEPQLNDNSVKEDGENPKELSRPSFS